jgi:hypothetical protein
VAGVPPAALTPTSGGSDGPAEGEVLELDDPRLEEMAVALEEARDRRPPRPVSPKEIRDRCGRGRSWVAERLRGLADRAAADQVGHGKWVAAAVSARELREALVSADAAARDRAGGTRSAGGGDGA